MGRKGAFPARHDQGGGRARLCVHLCQRGIGRHRPRSARSRADHGGDVLWMPRDERLHLDPQYGELDDRPLRRRRGEGEIPAFARHDGQDGELLPHRAGLGLRRRSAQGDRKARGRPLCRQRHQAVHLGRRGQRHLCDDGAHGAAGAEGHFVPRHRKGYGRRQLRRQGKEAWLERLADRAGDVR